MQLDPSYDRKVRQVAGADAVALVETGIRVLDVRTPGEFSGLGHIPGATLLPVQLIASAPAVLGDVDTPVLVTCEHAVRSKVATRLLAQAGFTQVYELAHGMALWDGPRAHESQAMTGPSPWLFECGDLIPRSGRALDVACGRGRHALLLASTGLDVTAIDRDADALARLQDQADRLGLAVQTRVTDLETSDVDLGEPGYDLVLVTRYLHRPLMPHLLLSLAPGGVLLYETFLTRQAETGHPKNPAFLLAPGELLDLVRPLEVLRQFEGEFDGHWIAAVAARR
ncbi:rhodanese-like domain-containing protein [Luteitalea sp.]|uniref:rhodanese-like domain-containing protein n=1 Tax=Luteitalea sp. TaxID=2004800 RepID=UPI000AC48D18|nr:rhodanese-like domain-containing protein [Luteitalea sp.]